MFDVRSHSSILRSNSIHSFKVLQIALQIIECKSQIAEIETIYLTSRLQERALKLGDVICFCESHKSV